MTLDPLSWVHGPVVPALLVDTVQTIQTNVAGCNGVGKCTDHAAIFKIEESPKGGRKDQHRQARMPEYKQLHVPAKAWTIPAVILAIHRGALAKLAFRSKLW